VSLTPTRPPSSSQIAAPSSSQVTPTRSKSRSIPWSLRHFGDQKVCVFATTLVVAVRRWCGCSPDDLRLLWMQFRTPKSRMWNLVRLCVVLCFGTICSWIKCCVCVKVYPLSLQICIFFLNCFWVLEFPLAQRLIICTVEVRCLSRASVVEFVWGSLFFHVFFLDVHCFSLTVEDAQLRA